MNQCRWNSSSLIPLGACALSAVLALAACGTSIDGTLDPTRAGQTDGGQDGLQRDASVECGSLRFPVTDTQESFVVPNNVKYMHVKAWGAGGNGEGFCSSGEADNEGGIGGYSEAVFRVEAGEELLVIVGKRGRAGITNEDINRFGFGSWGGGGLTGVFAGGPLVEASDNGRALIIAGGGGSAGLDGCAPGGTGNHPDSGGAGDMQGTAGGEEINGGGGGYHGGFGGSGAGSAKGGAGFIAPDALESLMLHSDRGAGTAPNSADSDYADNAGMTEQSGLLVMHFSCERPTIE